jgi:hypothetical protein
MMARADLSRFDPVNHRDAAVRMDSTPTSHGTVKARTNIVQSGTAGKNLSISHKTSGWTSTTVNPA